MNDRSEGEIVCGRRRRGRPFQRPTVPGIAGHVAQSLAANDADGDLHEESRDTQKNEKGANSCDDKPDLKGGIIEHTQPARHAHQPEHIERHEGEPEAHHPEPEGHLAPERIEPEAERLGEPVADAGEHSKQHPADDDVVEVRDQEQTIVQHEVGGRHREQHAGHAADDESDHEGEEPHHRQFEADAAAIHREQPVEHLGTGRDRDDHGRDPEEGIHARARAHGEEVVQPDQIGQDGDHDRGVDHRGVAKQSLARERRSHFRKDAEGGQDQDVDFRMAPDPDEVHVHHRIAAEVVREEVRADVAV